MNFLIELTTFLAIIDSALTITQRKNLRLTEDNNGVEPIVFNPMIKASPNGLIFSVSSSRNILLYFALGSGKKKRELS